MTADPHPRTIEALAACAVDDAWPRAREPLASAVFRASADDFLVREELGFAPDGDGEFALLRVAKTGVDTAAVATELARLARVPGRSVGWAGRKDRVARAEQWFCVHLPGRDGPPWDGLAGEGWVVLEAHRHRRKLRVGALESNHFRIVLRDVRADAGALAERARAVAADGAPAYFGPQRFGGGGRNLLAAAAGRLGRRNARSMALSAARSALFNVLLAERVRDGSWNRYRPGDVPMLRASRSIFGPEPPAAGDALAARLAAGEIDLTGPLWGRGEPRTAGPVRELEESVAARFPPLAKVVEEAGMRQERRRLRQVPRDLSLESLDDGCWALAFGLEAGAFATSIVREFFDLATNPA